MWCLYDKKDKQLGVEYNCRSGEMTKNARLPSEDGV